MIKFLNVARLGSKLIKLKIIGLEKRCSNSISKLLCFLESYLNIQIVRPRLNEQKKFLKNVSREVHNRKFWYLKCQEKLKYVCFVDSWEFSAHSSRFCSLAFLHNKLMDYIELHKTIEWNTRPFKIKILLILI